MCMQGKGARNAHGLQRSLATRTLVAAVPFSPPDPLSLLPQAETRAEFAERSVAKLEKTIDDLEGRCQLRGGSQKYVLGPGGGRTWPDYQLLESILCPQCPMGRELEPRRSSLAHSRPRPVSAVCARNGELLALMQDRIGQ